jgi:hypothetical protein
MSLQPSCRIKNYKAGDFETILILFSSENWKISELRLFLKSSGTQAIDLSL